MYKYIGSILWIYAIQISKKVEIVYTGITADNTAKKTIAALEGNISSDINTCTHLVTDKVKPPETFIIFWSLVRLFYISSLII